MGQGKDPLLIRNVSARFHSGRNSYLKSLIGNQYRDSMRGLGGDGSNTSASSSSDSHKRFEWQPNAIRFF